MNIHSISFREYQPEDKAALIKLFEDFMDFLIPLDPLERLIKNPGYGVKSVENIENDVRNKQGKWILACDGDKIIGWIIGLVVKNSEVELLSLKPSKLGRVTELYIDDAYRSQGIGKMLIEQIEQYLKSLDCDYIFIEVFIPNVNAHEFYKKLGYTDRNLDMIKKIK